MGRRLGEGGVEGRVEGANEKQPHPGALGWARRPAQKAAATKERRRHKVAATRTKAGQATSPEPN